MKPDRAVVEPPAGPPAGKVGGEPIAAEPVFPGFREIASGRRGLLADLVCRRRDLGLSQTEVSARMRTSQSAVARLEGQAGDLRLSTLERYAAALGQQIEWRLAAPTGPAANRHVAGRSAITTNGEPR